MEFACGFVYVSPATQIPSEPSQVKRSALLPPRKGRYLHSPPPATPPKPKSALLPPKPPTPPKPIKPLTPPISTSPKPTTQTTALYQNLPSHLNTVSSPPPVWKKHLNHAHSPPLTLPKPIRKPQTPESEPNYELPTTEYRRPPVTPRSHQTPSHIPAAAPPLPPRPSYMKRCPEYDSVLPAPFWSARDRLTSSSSFTLEAGDVDKQPLPGNPNVLRVRLGKLVCEEPGERVRGEPTSCSACGSVLESCYDNMVKECYFCHSRSSASSPAPDPPTGCEDVLYLLTPDLEARPPDRTLLIFCICTSSSMSSSAGVEGTSRSRLHSVQEAMLQCVQTLSEKNPELCIGLITFSDEITMHSFGEGPSRVLPRGKLSDKEHLKEAGLNFPTPPLLSDSQASLQMEIHKLQEHGASALGAAALVSIMMASKHPGSKVLVCTDGVPNAGLGSLDPERSPSCSIVSSSIFYQELGETAAAHGVSVSVVSLEGSDCRLDELGRLTDGTGGKVIISGCDELYVEFMGLIADRTMATHCAVTLLLPSALRVKGEKEAGHRGTREVGNVTGKSEITVQFGETEKSGALLGGRSVCVQLQVRYRCLDGLSVLRVLTVNLDTTEDSSQVLSSLRLSILLLNAGQTSASLALRGRFRDARRERDAQKQLVHRALRSPSVNPSYAASSPAGPDHQTITLSSATCLHIRSSGNSCLVREHRQNTDEELTYREWIRTTDYIYSDLHRYTQSLSDVGAALMYAIKNNYYYS